MEESNPCPAVAAPRLTKKTLPWLLVAAVVHPVPADGYRLVLTGSLSPLLQAYNLVDG